MKSLRMKLILVLIVINLVASVLSELLATPLLPEIAIVAPAWVLAVIKPGLRSGMTLMFFTSFIIIGVHEITAPVLSLSHAADRIAEGDYYIYIPETRRKDEVGRLQNSFGVMVKELRSTEYMQKDFISNVSHEYKTPLAVISGYARLLADDALPAPERAQYSAFIVEEADRLSRMTSNILLLSKLENQSIQPAPERFSLDEQLRQAALLEISACQAKGITLDIDAPAIPMRGNEELLMHIWTNLLENAVKFTPEGGTIAVRARTREDSAIVTVTDTGIGMDQETAAHIFDQFYQADASREGAGTGLGLSLARRVAQLHRGGIEVASVPGEGTTFTVTLPL